MVVPTGVLAAAGRGDIQAVSACLDAGYPRDINELHESGYALLHVVGLGTYFGAQAHAGSRVRPDAWTHAETYLGAHGRRLLRLVQGLRPRHAWRDGLPARLRRVSPE